ncbi:MAG: type II secretion system protein GspN [Deltaproteobacteria bacterium]|nr:type II secretion system protein GspN [Deltaproteobacteria bacterium]
MRAVLALALAITGCSQRSTSEEVETGPFDPADTVRRSDDAVRVEVHRREVPLAEMPIIAQSLWGLPMTGMGSGSIDLAAPRTDGRVRYSQASGTIALACPAGCTLGDGRTQLAFGGLGAVDFGHLAFDSVDIRASVQDGRAEITTWLLASKDIELHARMRIVLDDDLASSTLDGCLWFKESPALVKVQPRTAALIQTTGASINRDGFYSIKITGTLGASKRLAQECAAL